MQAKWFSGITIPLEFHASAIRAGKERFRSFSPTDRALLLAELYGLLADEESPHLVAFATAIDVSAVSTPTQALGDAFEDICQQFDTFLARGFARGTRNKGLLIIDRSSYSEPLYRDLISRFRSTGTRYGYLHNIVDAPLFTESHYTRFMQLADLVSWAAFRYHESNDPLYLAHIFPRFDRSRPQAAPPDGFRHISARVPVCTCAARH
ncbi:MAG: DUF3800 domain-containing protein [Elusimicrobia bacterium]|nr:DUF3800 domain-containing protein [Elusimicrobiota bacterium]